MEVPKQTLKEMLHAMLEARSDFKWAQKAVPGTNFKASILLLEHNIEQVNVLLDNI